MVTSEDSKSTGPSPQQHLLGKAVNEVTKSLDKSTGKLCHEAEQKGWLCFQSISVKPAGLLPECDLLWRVWVQVFAMV